MVMTFTVRALSVFLAMWLTAASAFPPCCWSMSSAHAHQPVPDSAPSDAATSAEHHHNHHGNDDSDAVGGAAPALSSIAAYDCDAELADAAATMAVVKRAALRPMAESAADFVVPISAHAVAGSNTSPPGSTFTSAFLSPLRI